ncbi:ABC-type Na+ efflux pump, permease component [Terriglobus roseus DSM 18391]|uniref:ABC-type Na+ efflux pump, permease component n=1 Tax=Terriglobus roseus (strain DSM 18391 / NRRL B-41598 / KBS 63) TaxID=926566 RepID=I3ZBC9_TERRK|nr:ABC transporter permease [Terriglobus roseus]AFL86547.1 ABC-type Na+ efflux pump, permease component [Terriglobus roseus DSM 18391]
MRNIFLIARREYLERVRTKGFMIATILIPLLMGGGITASILIAKHSKSSSHIVIVSPDLALANDVQDQLNRDTEGEMLLNIVAPPSANTLPGLKASLKSKDIDGYLWITPAAQKGAKPKIEYRQGSSADLATRNTVRDALDKVLTRDRLVAQGMSKADVADMMSPITMNAADEEQDSTSANFAGAYVLFFLMYMVIMLYGMNVARSIIEEKTSRVFEVMLATVKPAEMMAGKVIGVGSVGLTQVFIWMAAAVVLTATPLLTHFLGGGTHISLSAAQVGYFIVYFLLGYLLYSSIAAALGAMTNSEQELQQLNMFLVMPLAACMVTLPLVLNSPNSIYARILSLIPFCTPLLMYMRISVSPVPWYEIAASIVLMAITIYVVLWIASRIYRVGILMYGKKPNLPEIVRWMKYS